MEQNLVTAYKVVEDKTRWSTNWAYYKQFSRKQKVPRSKYTKKYLFGKKVYKVKDSIGLMAFDSLESAEIFINYSNTQAKLIIIKVEGKLCKEQAWEIISAAAGNNFINLGKNNLESWEFRSPPSGTLFFDWLKVLE